MNLEASIVELGRLKREPGDLLVFKMPPDFEPSEFHHFREYLLRGGVQDPFIILPQDIQMEIVSGGGK